MKKVIIDDRQVILKHQKKISNPITLYERLKEKGVTQQSVLNWRKKAPMVVSYLNDIIKETGCTFQDIVFEIENKK